MNQPEGRAATSRLEVNIGLRTLLLILASGAWSRSRSSPSDRCCPSSWPASWPWVSTRWLGNWSSRGWPRGRAALTVFAGLFVAVFLIVVITVGPLWDQVKEFVNMLPEYWEELTQTAVFETLTTEGREGLRELGAGGPCQGPARSGQHAPWRGRRRVWRGAVTGHAVIPGSVPADGASHDHGLAVRVRAPRSGRPLATRGGGVDRGCLPIAAGQHRHLLGGRHGRRAFPRGRSGCHFRSCWP